MTRISFSLEGRKALVVGADSGIGLACAQAIAEAGADLVMAGLNAEAGAQLASELAGKSGTKVHFLTADVREEDQVKAMVDEAASLLGGIDIAMNNAGIPGPSCAIQDIPTEDFDRLFAINVRGAWLGMKYEIPHMLAGGKGSIINLASTAALTGLGFVAAYAATKHAVAGLTKSAALELAQSNIRVNAIAPGPVDTNLMRTMRAARIEVSKGPGAVVPMGRFADPDEMAGAVIWLASDASSYVTGAIVSLDGGVVAL